MLSLCKFLKEKENVQRVACSSGGNAGVACAYACKKLGLKLHVFLPTKTRPLMIERLRSYDAELTLFGNSWKEADDAARAFIQNSAENIGYAPPFDHPAIWEGNSAIVDELDKQLEDMRLIPDRVICSVGGGGLLGGILTGLEKSESLKHVKVVGVETHGTASLHESLKAGKVVRLPKISGIAHSLGSPHPASKVLDMAMKKHDAEQFESILVSDEECLNYCDIILNETRFLVEPACAASMAAISEISSSKETIVVVLCGGSAITNDILRDLHEQVSSSP